MKTIRQAVDAFFPTVPSMVVECLTKQDAIDFAKHWVDHDLTTSITLSEEINTLQKIIAQSYQVIGILADEAGRFDDPCVIKAMDNLGSGEMQHDDVLPFPCKEDTTRMYTIASELQDRCDKQAVLIEKLQKMVNHHSQEPFGYWFCDDPQVFAMPGAGFSLGPTKPQSALHVTPLYTSPDTRSDDDMCPTPSAIVAGAIFDFAGFLTVRKEVIRVGSSANAAVMADLVKEWAGYRNLAIDDAAVRTWDQFITDGKDNCHNSTN